MAVKTFPTVRSAYAKITKAQAAAGYNLVPAAADRKYTVLDSWARSTGNSASANVKVWDLTTTVVNYTQAGLTNLAVLRAGTATTGVATNLLTALAVNKPIAVLASADDATATHFEVYVEYAVSTVGETA
jgi:hypothetical protein